MNDNREAQADAQIAQSPPLFKDLGLLVGQWDVELIFPSDPPGRVQEQAVFDWLEGGAFMIEHWGDSTWIIGPDEGTDTYSILYHDGRGVSRVYQMSLNDGVWKMCRNAPGFSQRFEGTFSDDNSIITARWETSSDGLTWEHDFDLTYTKVR